jgi:hypothetical protein
MKEPRWLGRPLDYFVLLIDTIFFERSGGETPTEIFLLNIKKVQLDLVTRVSLKNLIEKLQVLV